MTTRRRGARCVVGGLALAASSCANTARIDLASTALGDDSITIGSFDFAESQVIASIYGKVLEMNGYDVDLQLAVGPRELLLPALASGLVELVPEYSGTALQFISAGAAVPQADPDATHDALVDALAPDGRILALAPSPAQDANAIVVTQRTADEFGLVTISDLIPIADQLTFGGPPECPSRPFCLLGLETVYELRFGEVLALDAGGPSPARRCAPATRMSDCSSPPTRRSARAGSSSWSTTSGCSRPRASRRSSTCTSSSGGVTTWSASSTKYRDDCRRMSCVG